MAAKVSFRSYGGGGGGGGATTESETIAGNNTDTYTIPGGATLLLVVTDGIVRNGTIAPVDYVYTQATGTIVFASVISSSSVITFQYHM